MTKTLLLEQTAALTRLAVIEDDRLVELCSEPIAGEVAIGDIFLGRVMNVLPGMRAAFIDIGLDKNGFLSLDDMPVPEQQAQVKPLQLKPGHEMMVQVFKLPSGDKGLRLSGSLSLPGRMLVLMPSADFISCSRKIEDKGESVRLMRIAKALCPAGMGLVIRTAAEGADEQSLKEDIAELLALWEKIGDKARYSKAPALIQRSPGLADQAAQQALASDVEALLVEDEALLAQLACPKARLHTSGTGLFQIYRVDAQAGKMRDRRVWLPSGGYIAIDPTEALTVIDVNSGKFVGKQSLDETILRTNQEAAIEIARQIRLRDIGGIVIVDFIDMETDEDRERIQCILQDELKKDAAKTTLLGFTRLGLMELTRKKRRAPTPKESK